MKTQREKVSRTTRTLFVLIFTLSTSVALVDGQGKTLKVPIAPQSVKARQIPQRHEILNRITREDMALILKDADPMQLKQLAANPKAKGEIAENLRQLLAVASQAGKEGLAEDPIVRRELENTRLIITASLYDKKINGGKGAMPPFSFITKEQVRAFWGEERTEPGGLRSTLNKAGSGALAGNADARRRQMEFKEFLDSKIALAKESGKYPKDKELTVDEIKQAKDDFAKIKIYEEEVAAKKNQLGEEFNRELELQIKLQQAQFLASRYAQKNLAEKVKVTDEDVKKYIETHPELNPAVKKAKAENILKRAKAGEDFAKLADQNSDDPGTKGAGGLYKNVAKGKFIFALEEAALALEPGQIAEKLVETPVGFFIIKLERKSANGKPNQTYSARYILISTTVKDPNNPQSREIPVNEMVRETLRQEKEKQVLDKIVADNPVEVAEDFIIPQK